MKVYLIGFSVLISSIHCYAGLESVYLIGNFIQVCKGYIEDYGKGQEALKYVEYEKEINTGLVEGIRKLSSNQPNFEKTTEAIKGVVEVNKEGNEILKEGINKIVNAEKVIYMTENPWLFKAGDECHPLKISLASSHGL